MVNEVAPVADHEWSRTGVAPRADGETARRLLFWRIVLAALISGWVILAITFAPGARLEFRVALWAVPLIVGLPVVAAVEGFVRSRRRQRAQVRSTQEGIIEVMRQERSRFVARLDHELKNPLTAIRAALPLLDSPDASERSEGRVLLENQTTRLTRLIQELRKLNDLETRPLELAEVDVAQLLEDVVGATGGVRELPESPRINLDLPRTPWPLPVILADMDLLYIAVFNLIGNAMKFSRPEYPIEVRATEDGDFIQVEVSDSGRGIDAADLPFVFEEFARAPNARDVEGSGLGLAMARMIARRHGGDVRIESRLHQGTRVRLTVRSL